MKHLVTFFIICFWLTACKKEMAATGELDLYMERVKLSLKDSTGTTILDSLDFSRAILSKADSTDLHFLNVPFADNSIESFVLLQTDKSGTIQQGRVIRLAKTTSGYEKPFSYEGTITVRSLKQEILIESDILEGRITERHRYTQAVAGNQLSSAQLVLPSNTLPEVIVICNREPSGGISYSDWINLQSMFGSGTGIPSSYYSPMDGSGGGGYSGGSSGGYSGGGGSVSLVPPIAIDFETQNGNPAIDIATYIKCFATIPDVGSICSIEIFTDIPVDKDPNKLFNWETESPGHTFLQIKKTNGSQSVVQNLGFYPKTNWKTILSPAPVEGKFVDNGRHEFNASIKTNLTPVQLQNALTRISYLARFTKYDIDEYNCTDFALEVFNHVRSTMNQLVIPKYSIPGGMASQGTSTPQGLYNKLKSMQQSGSSETSNITIAGYKGWVAGSNGPCN